MTGVENQAFEDVQPYSGAVLAMKEEEPTEISKAGKVKVPRRVLHCSDGVYEEYSTDEEEEQEQLRPVVDPKTLRWGPYLWHLTTKTAFGGLAVCDYLGEKLAWFFGITSPRYQYAIDEVLRMQQEEKEQKEQEKEEREAELQFVKTSKTTKSTNYGASGKRQGVLNTSDVTVSEKAAE